MAAYFFDTSALVKRYASETGTAWATALLDPAAGHRIYVARITGVECVAALTRKVRGHHLTAADAATAIMTLRNELANLLRVVEVTPALLSDAMALAEKHALRGYDAVQLAATIEASNERAGLKLPALTLVTADVELLAAGETEGLATDDPNTH